MKRQNVELKAHVESLDPIRQSLIDQGARYIGKDHQRDTYFNVPQGRLKIRQGSIESCIVWYERPDVKDIRQCNYHLVTCQKDDPTLESMHVLFTAVFGVVATVTKDREIYFIDNAKFHLDLVSELGYFVEIEIIGRNGDTQDTLGETCEWYRNLLDIERSRLIAGSYADLIRQHSSI